jgi:hypothetical protein
MLESADNNAWMLEHRRKIVHTYARSFATMRHPLTISSCALLLASCALINSPSPAEVLRKSAIANQELLSANFMLNADFDAVSEMFDGQTSGTINAEGVLQNGGRQMDVMLRGSGMKETSAERWTVDVRSIIADERNAYINVNELSISEKLSAYEQLRGGWWKLPSMGTSDAPVSPDPRFLRMQAEAIDVIKDNGITLLDGHSVHHYDVIVNKAKLAAFISAAEEDQEELAALQMSGEVWIDARTYVIRKAHWVIHSSDALRPFDINLTIDVTAHGEPVMIVPPENAQELPSIPASTGVPQEDVLPVE